MKSLQDKGKFFKILNNIKNSANQKFNQFLWYSTQFIPPLGNPAIYYV